MRHAIATLIATLALAAPAAATPNAFTDDSPERIECWQAAAGLSYTPIEAPPLGYTRYGFYLGSVEIGQINCHPSGGTDIRSTVVLLSGGSPVPGTEHTLRTTSGPGEFADHHHEVERDYIPADKVRADYRLRLLGGVRWVRLNDDARRACERRDDGRLLVCTQTVRVG